MNADQILEKLVSLQTNESDEALYGAVSDGGFILRIGNYGHAWGVEVFPNLADANKGRNMYELFEAETLLALMTKLDEAGKPVSRTRQENEKILLS